MFGLIAWLFTDDTGTMTRAMNQHSENDVPLTEEDFGRPSIVRKLLFPSTIESFAVPLTWI